jgi:hypothetical protein
LGSNDDLLEFLMQIDENTENFLNQSN